MLEKVFTNKCIPIVFATDNNFVPYLYVALKSLLDNANPENNYDIVILYSDVNDYNKKRLSEFVSTNVSVRFVEMSGYMEPYKEHWYTHWTWTEAMYYRFFIPEIFSEYEKVLYLDGDVIFNCDISELYNVEMGNNMISAVQDLPRLLKEDKFVPHIEDNLKMSPDKYFNSGVLVFNVREMIKANFLQNCINILEELKNPVFPDQDVLNVVCKDRVLYLDITYNLSWNLLHFHYDFAERLTQNIYQKYMQAWKNPKIIHYAGGFKPWKQPDLEYSEYFWKYARQTSFYEEIVYKNCKNTLGRAAIQNVVQRRKIYLNYLKCKLFGVFTFGKMKEHYIEKKTRLKNRIKDYRQTLAGKI